jgi:hypothetical protein
MDKRPESWKSQQRGVLALAFEQALEKRQQQGQVIYLGDHLLGEIGRRMNDLLQCGRLGVEQTPFLTPPSAQVLLFKPQKACNLAAQEVGDTGTGVFSADSAAEIPLDQDPIKPQCDTVNTLATDTSKTEKRRDIVIGVIFGCVGFAIWKLYLLYTIERTLRLLPSG